MIQTYEILNAFECSISNNFRFSVFDHYSNRYTGCMFTIYSPRFESTIFTTLNHHSSIRFCYDQSPTPAWELSF